MLRDEDMLASIAEQIRGVGDRPAPAGEARRQPERLPTTAHRWPQHYGLSGVQFDAVQALSGQPDPHGVIALFRLGPGTQAVTTAR
jgi:hypothetical protein